MKDNDNGIILPIPKKKNDIGFNMMDGPGLGFQLNLDIDEYITVGEAAKILGVSKTRMEEIVESEGPEKHDPTGDRYLLSKNEIENLI